MEICKVTQLGTWESNDEPLLYFKGSKKNGERLIEELCKRTGGKNSLNLDGQQETLIYFECSGKITCIYKEKFDYFKLFGLRTKEIKAKEYKKFNNELALTIASAIKFPIYWKNSKGEFCRCEIMDSNFKKVNGEYAIIIKVKENEGYSMKYISRDFKKADLYY